MSQFYRPEIDGLRAVAVIPVVLFHAGVPWLSGGFVGVDIFFVISGYLITTILMTSAEQNTFSIITFYERRIRRIFPALFAVLAISTLLASWILLAPEFNNFGKSLFYSTLFLSNHFFMGDVGYFAGAADTKPLLHMWSLAVEEQFYIFFPLYIFGMVKFAKNILLSITIGIFSLSFLACIILTQHFPDMAFYLAPTRAWELLAGAILALLPHGRKLNSFLAQLIGLAGLASIGCAIFIFDETTAFPGYAALLPVFGAAAIIYSSSTQKTLTGNLLSLYPIRFIGLISYSLYLWHWPFIVFYKLWRIEHPSSFEIFVVIIITFFVATLSWRYIEGPFRNRNFLAKRSQVITSGIAVMLTTATFGIAIALLDGFPDRFPNQITPILAKQADSWARENCTRIPAINGVTNTACPVGEGPPRFAVLGDSHGAALLPAFDAASQLTNTAGIFIGNSGCIPLLNISQTRQGFQNCYLHNDLTIDYLAKNPNLKDIYLVSRWSIYALGEPFGKRQGKNVYIKDLLSKSKSLAENKLVFERNLTKTLSALNQVGRNIFIVTQIPETEFDIPITSARAIWLNKTVDLRPTSAAYIARQAFVSKQFQKAQNEFDITIIPIEKAACPFEFCIVEKGGLPVYRDDNHITIDYAKSLGPFLAPFLSQESVSNL